MASNERPDPAMVVIDGRIESLTTWLKMECPKIAAEQKHLDDETAERAYWHYGYLVALRDVRDLLTANRQGLN